MVCVNEHLETRRMHVEWAALQLFAVLWPAGVADKCGPLPRMGMGICS